MPIIKETVANTLRREYYRVLQDVFILMPIVEAGDSLRTWELYSFDCENERSVLISPEEAEILLEYKKGRARELDGKIQYHCLGKVYQIAA